VDYRDSPIIATTPFSSFVVPAPGMVVIQITFGHLKATIDDFTFYPSFYDLPLIIYYLDLGENGNANRL
jgi:hypothetical protein